MSEERIITGSGVDLEQSLDVLFAEIKATILKKNRDYGQSWKKRGGTGAFHQGIARKWDRLENILKSHTTPYDILDLLRNDTNDVESITDTCEDLIAYLALCLTDSIAYVCNTPSLNPQSHEVDTAKKPLRPAVRHQ